MGRAGKYRWWLAGIVLAALVLRVTVSLLNYCFTFDTGTVELMALHILHGERPLFFYGQGYMGAAEAYLAALFLGIVGPGEFAVTLSPITMGLLWLIGMYLLFREIGGARTGLAAALTVAVPGWVIVWYTVAPYGGYPVFWAAGTWSLWAALRLWNRAGDTRGWWELAVVGALGGIGLWTNFQVVPFLAAAFLLCALWAVRVGLRRALVPAGVAALLFGVCAFPAIHEAMGPGLGRLAEWNFSPDYIGHTIRIAVKHTLRRLLFWRFHLPAGYMSVLVATLAVLGSLAAATLWQRRRDLRMMVGMAAVAVAIGVGLLMYLPHSLAALVAPRYLVGTWSLFFAAAVGLPLAARSKVVRSAAVIILTVWTVHFLIQDIRLIRAKAPSKARKIRARSELVTALQSCGASNAVLVGGNVFGLLGNGLSFFSREQIRFSAAFGERYFPYAQQADGDTRAALVCERRRRRKLEEALRDLGTDEEVRLAGGYGVVCSSRVEPLGGISISPEEIKCTPFGNTQGAGSNLLDRCRETVLSGSADGRSGIVVDLGRTRLISALRLGSLGVYRRGLPEGYRLEVSADGKTYDVIRECTRRFAVAYSSGPRAYAKGYLGACEIRFSPVDARYLRLTVTRAESRKRRWRFNEIYVFEQREQATDDRLAGTLEDEVKRIAAWARGRRAVFVAADRWLSARLWYRLPCDGDVPAVYPRFDPRHSFTLLSRRLSPYAGLVIAPQRPVKEECLRLIRRHWGKETIAEVRDFGSYSAILIANPPPESSPDELFWDGFTLLKTVDPMAGLYLPEARMHAERPGRPAHRPSPGYLRPLLLDVGSADDRRFLGYGWSRRENMRGCTARWMRHLEADVFFEAGRRADLLVTCRVAPMKKRGMTQGLGLYLNGRFLGWETLPGEEFRSVSFIVPAGCLRIGENTLTLRAAFRTRVPRDRRELAVAVDRILLVPLDRISAADVIRGQALISD